MSPEVFEKWENIIDDVEKTQIPVEFIKKLIVRLEGRKRKTINVSSMIRQGFDVDEIEDALARKLEEFDDTMIGIDFVLDIEGIAEIVQPETDKILNQI